MNPAQLSPQGVYLRPELPHYWPVSDAIIAPDVVVDFYGDVYLANPLLASRGITFEAFVSRALRKIEVGSNRALMVPFCGPLRVPDQYARPERSCA